VENWKLGFLSDRILVTAGEMGKVKSYNIDSGENVNDIISSDVFATSIATVYIINHCCYIKQSKNNQLLAIGNALGGSFIYDINNSWKPYKISCHNKILRSMCFTFDCLKLVTGSDDAQIKVLDIVKLEPIITFAGHKGNVNWVDCSPVDNKLLVSW